MPRSIPKDRFTRLVEVATDIFIAGRGYHRTQMSDVAEALGVAKGTLYLYVESKEALFDLVTRNLDSGAEIEVPENLPLPTPAPGATLEYAREMLLTRSQTPLLQKALTSEPTGDDGAEVEAIAQEIYRLCATNRRSIKLIDSCAHDHPELGALWFEGGREGLMELVLRYLDARPALAVGYPDKTVVARMAIETIVFWAVHRHWDPHPQEVDERIAERTVVSFVRRALTQEVNT